MDSWANASDEDLRHLHQKVICIDCHAKWLVKTDMLLPASGVMGALWRMDRSIQEITVPLPWKI